MVVENPLALSYILPGDVFFLQSDRADVTALLPTDMPESVIGTPVEQIVTPAPVAQIKTPEPIPAIPTIPPVVQEASPVVPSTPPTSTQTPAPAFNYTGGYQKKFLVFVYYPDYPVMDAAHQNALESTIKRKELSLDDIAIFNLAQYPGADLKAIGGFFKPQKMLFLGKPAIPAGWNAPAFNQLTKLSKCDVLCTYSFGEMMGNKDNTKAFWEQMKAL